MKTNEWQHIRELSMLMARSMREEIGSGVDEEVSFREDER
jgi:hypothetical protein